MGSITDHDLLKVFIEIDGSKPPGRDEQRAEFVTRLRPHVLWHVARRWPRERKRHADVEADCFVLLMRWRAEGLLVATEPLWRLAWRLVQQVSKAEFRDQEHERQGVAELEAEPPPQLPDLEKIASQRELIGRLVALFALLPEVHAKVLEAQVAEALGHGPSLEMALGCDRAVARKRLERARVALVALALEWRLGATLMESGIKIVGGTQ
jgi:hypothetical protein